MKFLVKWTFLHSKYTLFDTEWSENFIVRNHLWLVCFNSKVGNAVKFQVQSNCHCSFKMNYEVVSKGNVVYSGNHFARRIRKRFSKHRITRYTNSEERYGKHNQDIWNGRSDHLPLPVFQLGAGCSWFSENHWVWFWQESVGFLASSAVRELNCSRIDFSLYKNYFINLISKFYFYIAICDRTHSLSNDRQAAWWTCSSSTFLCLLPFFGSQIVVYF